MSIYPLLHARMPGRRRFDLGIRTRISGWTGQIQELEHKLGDKNDGWTLVAPLVPPFKILQHVYSGTAATAESIQVSLGKNSTPGSTFVVVAVGGVVYAAPISVSITDSGGNTMVSQIFSNDSLYSICGRVVSCVNVKPAQVNTMTAGFGGSHPLAMAIDFYELQGLSSPTAINTAALDNLSVDSWVVNLAAASLIVSGSIFAYGLGSNTLSFTGTVSIIQPPAGAVAGVGSGNGTWAFTQAASIAAGVAASFS